MFLLEKMLDEMVRTTQRQQLDKNSISRLPPPRSTFVPALPFGCLLIEYVKGDKSNQPRLLRGDWQIGGVITATKHARCKRGWMTPAQALTQIYVFVHGCIQVVCDRHVWVCPAATCLFLSLLIFQKRKKIMKATLTNYENAADEALLVPSKITSPTALLICRPGHNVQTDCCMLCLVHREISGLCMAVEDLLICLAAFVLVRLNDQQWGKTTKTGELRCTVIAVGSGGVFCFFVFFAALFRVNKDA